MANDTPTLSTLNARSRDIFARLVETYLETGEPVGSRTLSKMAGLGLSAASIRNVMQDLEQLGLLDSPHISAGRIPTQTGLRLFVDGVLEIAVMTLGMLAFLAQESMGMVGLLVVLFLMGGQSALFGPPKYGILPEMLNDRLIPAASILRRSYCREEQERLQHLRAEDLRQAVLRHWLIKEASIKWQQGAISRDLRFWEVRPGMSSVVHQRSQQTLAAALHDHDAWAFAVVAADQQVLQSITLCLA